MNQAIAAFACLCVLASPLAGHAQDSLRVTPSALPRGGDPGFRCGFWQTKPEATILWADDDSIPDRRALITVNGKAVMLAPTGIKWTGKGGGGDVGDKLEMSFAGSGVRVNVVATVTWTCPSDSENCEVTKYRAKILVTAGGASTTINARGDCGS